MRAYFPDKESILQFSSGLQHNHSSLEIVYAAITGELTRRQVAPIGLHNPWRSIIRP
jgi:hypothetical protein